MRYRAQFLISLHLLCVGCGHLRPASLAEQVAVLSKKKTMGEGTWAELGWLHYLNGDLPGAEGYRGHQP